MGRVPSTRVHLLAPPTPSGPIRGSWTICSLLTSTAGSQQRRTLKRPCSYYQWYKECRSSSLAPSMIPCGNSPCPGWVSGVANPFSNTLGCNCQDYLSTHYTGHCGLDQEGAALLLCPISALCHGFNALAKTPCVCMFT